MPFAPNDTNADPAIRTFGGEKWDGYPVDRQKMLDCHRQQRELANTVVITGDVHANFVRNVPPDHVRLDAEPVATEFIGTSISSGGDRTLSARCSAATPTIRTCASRTTITATCGARSRRTCGAPTTASCRRSSLPDDGGISTLASFVVEQSQPGAQPA